MVCLFFIIEMEMSNKIVVFRERIKVIFSWILEIYFFNGFFYISLGEL